MLLFPTSPTHPVGVGGGWLQQVLQPDAEGEAHDGLPGEATGSVEQAVLVLVPPAAVDILLADLALGPAAVGGTGLVGVHGDVLHNDFSFFLLFGVVFCFVAIRYHGSGAVSIRFGPVKCLFDLQRKKQPPEGFAPAAADLQLNGPVPLFYPAKN